MVTPRRSAPTSRSIAWGSCSIARPAWDCAVSSSRVASATAEVMYGAMASPRISMKGPLTDPGD